MPHTESKLTLQQLHDELMQMYDKCPDDENCPFCAADRQAEAHERGDYSSDTPGTKVPLPNPEFCYTPGLCAGKTCCPHNPSCTE